MKNVDVPEDFAKQLTGEVVIIGPPPGISRNDCIDAKIHVTEEWESDGMGLGFTAFFKPSDEEIEHLAMGGLLKVQLRGSGLVPHALGIW